VTSRAAKHSVPGAPQEQRHRAREAALQMLYQWEVGRLPMDDVRATFWSHDDETAQPLGVDLRAFAEGLAEVVTGAVEQLDPMIAEAAQHWRVERMNVMDRLILRLALYEFLHEPETHAKVIINEALELARSFSGDEAVRFINGILDGIRRKIERE
jgi:N utilization substance protein B